MSDEEILKNYKGLKQFCGVWNGNEYDTANGETKKSQWRIAKPLKAFMIANPPKFPISDRCCYWSKKSPMNYIWKRQKKDLLIFGLRRAEGGVRSISYKSCFIESSKKSTKLSKKIDRWAPIFWFTDEDKKVYEKYFGVTHSRVYTEYGFKRTGCVGCPFNSKAEEDLEVLEKYEPNLVKAARNIFQESYDYHNEYLKFREEYNKNKRKEEQK